MINHLILGAGDGRSSPYAKTHHFRSRWPIPAPAPVFRPESPGRRGQASGRPSLNVTPKELLLPPEPEGGGRGASTTHSCFQRWCCRSSVVSWLRACQQKRKLPLLHRDERAGHASARRVKPRAPHGCRRSPAAQPPLRRSRPGAPPGPPRAPPPGRRGWHLPAGQSAGAPTASSPASRAVARARVCVRAAAAGRGRAGRRRVRPRGRGGSWGAAARGRPAGPGGLNSPALGLAVLLPASRQRLPHRAALPGPPVLGFRWRMLLLDCNPEVRLGPLLSCRQTLPDVRLLGGTNHCVPPSPASSE